MSEKNSVVLKSLVEKYLLNCLYDNAMFYAERLYYDSTTPEHLNLLATCYFRKNKFNQAYLLLQDPSHHSSSPDNAYLFALICVSLNKLLEGQNALFTARNNGNSPPTLDAVQDTPGGAAGVYLLGKICRKQHRRDYAVDYFKISLQMDPYLWCSIAELSEMGIKIDITELYPVEEANTECNTTKVNNSSNRRSIRGNNLIFSPTPNEAANGGSRSTARGNDITSKSILFDHNENDHSNINTSSHHHHHSTMLNNNNNDSVDDSYSGTSLEEINHSYSRRLYTLSMSESLLNNTRNNAMIASNNNNNNHNHNDVSAIDGNSSTMQASHMHMTPPASMLAHTLQQQQQSGGGGGNTQNVSMSLGMSSMAMRIPFASPASMSSPLIDQQSSVNQAHAQIQINTLTAAAAAATADRSHSGVRMNAMMTAEKSNNHSGIIGHGGLQGRLFTHSGFIGSSGGGGGGGGGVFTDDVDRHPAHARQRRQERSHSIDDSDSSEVMPTTTSNNIKSDRRDHSTVSASGGGGGGGVNPRATLFGLPTPGLTPIHSNNRGQHLLDDTTQHSGGGGASFLNTTRKHHHHHNNQNDDDDGYDDNEEEEEEGEDGGDNNDHNNDDSRVYADEVSDHSGVCYPHTSVKKGKRVQNSSNRNGAGGGDQLNTTIDFMGEGDESDNNSNDDEGDDFALHSGFGKGGKAGGGGRRVSFGPTARLSFSSVLHKNDNKRTAMPGTVVKSRPAGSNSGGGSGGGRLFRNDSNDSNDSNDNEDEDDQANRSKGGESFAHSGVADFNLNMTVISAVSSVTGSSVATSPRPAPRRIIEGESPFKVPRNTDSPTIPSHNVPDSAGLLCANDMSPVRLSGRTPASALHYPIQHQQQQLQSMMNDSAVSSLESSSSNRRNNTSTAVPGGLSPFPLMHSPILSAAPATTATHKKRSMLPRRTTTAVAAGSTATPQMSAMTLASPPSAVQHNRQSNFNNMNNTHIVHHDETLLLSPAVETVRKPTKAAVGVAVGGGGVSVVKSGRGGDVVSPERTRSGRVSAKAELQDTAVKGASSSSAATVSTAATNGGNRGKVAKASERVGRNSKSAAAAAGATGAGAVVSEVTHSGGHDDEDGSEGVVFSGAAARRAAEHVIITTAQRDRAHRLLITFATAYQQLCLYQCIDCIETLHTLSPEHFKSALSQQYIGKAYYEINEYKACVLAYREMLKVEPFRVQGLEILSTALWHLKRDKDLSSLAQQVVDIDRLAPETWCVVGNCFSFQKEPETAIKFFTRSLQLDPNFTYAYTLTGHELVNNEDLEKAIGSFRNALTVNDRHYQAWYGLGSLYYRQERYELAEYHFRRALGINNASSVLHCYLGMSLHAQNTVAKSTEALSVLNAACSADPRNPQLHFQRAHILVASDSLHEALEALTIVKEHAPKEPPVYSLLAQVYYRMGNTGEALSHLNTALDLDPKESNSLKAIMDAIDAPLQF